MWRKVGTLVHNMGLLAVYLEAKFRDVLCLLTSPLFYSTRPWGGMAQVWVSRG